MFFRPKEYFKTLIVKIIFIFPILFTSNILAQTIPGTGSQPATCGDCTPSGWSDNGGTPDVADRYNIGAQGTIGTGASWVTELPLPPTGDQTWISIRDVGGLGSEESVNTTMSGLVSGQVYKLTIYSLTSITNADGGTSSNQYYAGTYMDEFDYQIANFDRQTIDEISQNQWSTNEIVFLANASSMTLSLFPKTDANTGGSPYEGLEAVQIAVELNALELLDSDNDGVPDITDIDDDNDGVLDVDETNIGGTQYDPLGDEDGDKLPNYLDTNDNNDTSDGSITNYTDINSDGVPDIFDNDLDGVPNHLDLDSDNDGIPDNIEAQSTIGYISPSTDTDNDADNDGLNDAYDSDCTVGSPCGTSNTVGTGITPINSDGVSTNGSSIDTVPDYLDTDADGDGVLDNIEANISIGGSVGVNGLIAALDNGDNYNDVNGVFDNTQEDNFPDADSDVNTGGDVDYRDTSETGVGLDSDLDGIPNEDDLDDDNDGITDAQELCDTDFAEGATINVYIDLGAYENENSWTLTGPGGFSESGGTYADGDDIINLNFPATTTGDYTFTLSDTYGDGLDGSGSGGTGGSSNENATSSYRISVNGSVLYESGTFPTFGTGGSAAVFNFEISSLGTSFSCLATDPGADDDIDGTVNYSDPDYSTGVVGDVINANGIWTSLDLDGDGVPNHLDLDSDNDGIPDNIEAQATSNSSFISPSGIDNNNNGLDDNYETGQDGTTLSPINTDSGSDSLPDYKDTDSDNDGASDRIEANLSVSGSYGLNGLDSNYETGDNYSDSNGSFDDTQEDNFPNSTGTGDVDYRDVSSSFSDNDGDGIPDNIDVDDDNDGILDTVENAGGSTTGTCNITYELIGTIDGDRDRGSPNDLNKDFIFGDNFSFRISFDTAIPVVIETTIGDQDHARTGTVTVDGTSENISTAVANFQTVTHTPTSATSYDITMLGFDMTVTTIIVKDDQNNTIAQFDFGTSSSTLESGYIRVSSGTTQTTTTYSCIEDNDTDGDGIINSLDLDSDNDGIPDNIEAQTTTGYNAPSGDADETANGLDTAYGSGITPTDTDGDGTPDYLDLDADDDGILDQTEAGLSLSGSFGNNGLDNNYDNGDNYSDVNGSFDNTQTNNFPDVDGDVNSGGDLDFRDDTFTFDNDDDDVNDEIDLDDDNDGILDAVEYGSCSPVSNILDWNANYVEGNSGTSGDIPSEEGSLTISNVGVNIAISSNTYSDSDYRINNFVTTNGFTLYQKAIQNSESNHIFTFDTPIYGLNFILYDVDIESTTSTDEVEIILTAQDGSNYTLQAADYTVDAGSNTFSNNNTFTGTVSGGNGNITINAIPAWIIRMRIIYKNKGTGSLNGTQQIAIGNLSFCTPLDSDNDTVFDFRDLDSDGDGIPDNIEAQTTKDYIAPTGTYSIFGIDVAYGNGFTPINTDGTDNPDYLDLDSDNEGESDFEESGLADPSGTEGANGLDSNYEDADSYDATDINGLGDDTITDNYDDTDGDVNLSGGDLDFRDTVFGNDTDGDGIPDDTDIDDDNDGILDIDECENLSNGAGVNNVYSESGVGNNASNTLSSDNSRVTFNNTNDEVILDLTGDNNLPTGAIVYIEARVTVSTGNTLNVQQSSDGISFSNEQIYTWSSTGADENKEYILTSDARYLKLALEVYSGSGGVQVDYVSYGSYCSSDGDSDNDGIPNRLDIDADNDGIPDNIEAQSTMDYMAPSGIGAGITDANSNGLDDNYETDQGGTNLSPINTDSSVDNIPDYLDTDSDNDGTLDIEENGDSDNVISGIDTDGDGLDDNFEGTNTNDGYDVNDEIESPQSNLPDVDSDVSTGGDVDYRDDEIGTVTPSPQGALLWLRADLDATTSLWQDQSGLDHDATPGTNGPTLSSNAVNFNPAFSFNGSNQFMEIINATTGDGILESGTSYPDLAAYVVTSAGATQDGYIFRELTDDPEGDDFLITTPWGDGEVYYGIENGSSNINHPWQSSLNTYGIHNFYGSSNASNSALNFQQALYFNGINIDTGTSFQTTIDGEDNNHFYIGSQDGSQDFHDGEIAEIIVFTGNQSSETQQAYQSYLAIKYGITLYSTTTGSAIIAEDDLTITEGDYILSDESTKVWDYTVNSDYHNDIAGIGRDDGFALNQKQSKSINSDAVITIGLGSIATDNISNSNNFSTNKDFLVWGNNNGTISNTSTTTIICAPEKTLGRTWKIVENGSVGLVQIAISENTITDNLDTSTSVKVLKVADDALFTTNVEYVALTPPVNSETQYVCNYDFDGTKFFTYAEVNGIFWNGDANSGAGAWTGGSAADNSASTSGNDVDKVMIIDSESSLNHAVLNQDARVECVWIKENSVLTVADEHYLEFDEDFILDGNLKLVGDAQLIQTHVGQTNVQGTGKVYIDQKATVENQYRYHYWSSPVVEVGKSTFTVEAVMKDGTTPTSESSTEETPRDINFISESTSYDGSYDDNPADGTDPITIANYWIWSYISGTTGNDWQHKRHNTAINRGEGYTMKSTGNQDGQNFTFVGTPNDGTISIPVIKDSNSLIGNPYPSALDAIDFINENSDVISGTIYFWQHEGENGTSTVTEGHNIRGYQGGYATRNLGTSVAAQTTVDGTGGLGEGNTYDEPGRYIAVGQSFFVGAIANGTIVFENSHRNYQAKDGTNSVFLKTNKKKKETSEKEVIEEIPTLKIGFEYENDEQQIIHRQIAVSFANGLSGAHDNGYDSPIYDIQDNDTYWKFNESDTKYVIAGVAMPNGETELPLGVVVDSEKELTFQIDNMNFVNDAIYLKDHLLDITYKLSVDNAIKITVGSGSYEDRFSIVFKNDAEDDLLNIVDQENVVFNIRYNQFDKTIEIDNPNNIVLMKLQLVSMSGKKLKEFESEDILETLKVYDISDGVYVVRIKTSVGIITKKIAIY
ncbi:T9SS type A sorting domain-containing protein [Flavicella marina]|uniref:T9SS type A sorting domain-containing protein n=1 Tax=Flavicella marina TaxID=1475951 RepID=UPI0012653580|nr:T9SS type A sorting domain-containing protein [Flavicella marina]